MPSSLMGNHAFGLASRAVTMSQKPLSSGDRSLEKIHRGVKVKKGPSADDFPLRMWGFGPPAASRPRVEILTRMVYIACLPKGGRPWIWGVSDPSGGEGEYRATT
jgi:hypothetical protein